MGKIATIALAVALALPVPAGAAGRVVAPPGNSEADQYYETYPSASGPRSPDPSKKARDAVRDGLLGEGTEAALRGRGPTGLALATAVARANGGRGTGAAGTAPSDRVVGALGSFGMGAGFPLLLAAAVAAAAAFFVARRRGLVSR